MEIVRRRMDSTQATQADLARKTGIPPSTLSKIVRAKKVPHLVPLRQIILALGLTLSAVMAEAEAATSSAAPDDDQGRLNRPTGVPSHST